MPLIIIMHIFFISISAILLFSLKIPEKKGDYLKNQIDPKSIMTKN